MAKIPLRVYLNDVENLIERGEIEQAVAHAKNILRSYPKHLETYRLLGKAYLESQRYSEAADILQRVLSVTPDDFISQIGMSIIREDEGNMDAAIWHMERAYEVQPFNPAVQDELRRLYGRRDGVEPPKIRLTRGALVRMYTRGELYPQAIAETRAALSEDPQRLDLRVLLARLYYLLGQKNDAAEVCSELISKLPYCYEANRLLAEILPTTSRASETPKFQQRIYALDPYEAFISPSAPTSQQVPDQAVMVEQFLWEQGVEGSQTPDWTRTVGVAWEEQEEENLPDWLNTLKPEAPAADVAPAAEPVSDNLPSFDSTGFEIPADEDELVPGWMKEAGWGPTDRTADEIMAEQPVAGSDAIEPAEIPDWLQSMAPSETALPAEAEQDRSEWLENILSAPDVAAAASLPEVPQPEAALPDENLFEDDETPLPDWMAGFGSEVETTPAVSASLEQRTETTETGEDLPDWLSQLQNGDETPIAAISDEKQPDLDDLDIWSQAGDITGEPSRTGSAELPVQDETVDWLKSFEDEAESSTTRLADFPDWDASAGEEKPAASSSANDDIPDWLKTVDQESEIAIPDWLSAVETEAEPAQISPIDQLPEAGAEALPTDISIEAAQSESVESPQTLPEWLTGMTAAADSELEAMELPEAVELPEAIELPEAEIQPEPFEQLEESALPLAEEASSGMPDMNDTDAMMAWLESLAARQGADEATLTTTPDQRTDTPPDWVLKEMETTPSEEITQPVKTISDLPAEEPPVIIGQPLQEKITDAEIYTTPIYEQAAESSFEPQPTEEAAQAQPAVDGEAAAKAWLESLAGPRSVDHAEQTTNPEDVSTTIPDWLAQDQAVEEQPAVVEQPAVDEQPVTELQPEPQELPSWNDAEEIQAVEAQAVPVDEQPEAVQDEAATAEAQPSPDLSDMDAAMAWLESLAARQGADEQTLTTLPEDRTETPPDWVLKEMETAQEIAETEPESTAEAIETTRSLPDWLPASDEITETPAQDLPEHEFRSEDLSELASAEGWIDDVSLEKPEEASAVEAEMPAPEWLKGLEEEEIAEHFAEAHPMPWPDETAQFAQPTEPLPAWMQPDQETQSAPAAGEEKIPDWLMGLDDASPTELSTAQEGLPVDIDFSAAWEPEPISAIAEDALENPSYELDEVLEAPAATSEAQPGEWIKEAGDGSLETARAALNQGQLDQALEYYTQFIEKEENLSEVIHDLRDALYRYPVDVNLWQTLGDACARSNQLQEALDAYTKAEELLR